MTLLGLRGAARPFLREGRERKRGTEKTGQKPILHGLAKASLSPSPNTLLPRLRPQPEKADPAHTAPHPPTHQHCFNCAIEIHSSPQEGTQQKKHKPIAGNFQQGYEFHQMRTSSVQSLSRVQLCDPMNCMQHARPPCPSSTPRVHSDSRPSSR